jgi:hypothetical protein
VADPCIWAGPLSRSPLGLARRCFASRGCGWRDEDSAGRANRAPDKERIDVVRLWRDVGRHGHGRNGGPYGNALSYCPAHSCPCAGDSGGERSVFRMTGHRVCPWWVDLLATPFRRLMQDPTPIVTLYVRAGMTVLEPGPGTLETWSPGWPVRTRHRCRCSAPDDRWFTPPDSQGRATRPHRCPRGSADIDGPRRR